MSLKTNLEYLIESGIDEKARKIYLGHPNQDVESYGDVDMASISRTIRAINKFSSDAPHRPIELYVSSYGGDAYAMIGLIDTILACPSQIRFVGYGAVMSSAAWIMSVCDHRSLHENTSVLLHDGVDLFEGKNTDIKIEANESFRLQNLLEKVLAENSRMPANFWHDILKRDVYLTATEALALGICDEIIMPKKRGNLRKSRQHAMNVPQSKHKITKLVKSIFDRTGLSSRSKDVVIKISVDEIDDTLIIETREEIGPPEQESQ